jgi:hypothetical protein
MLGVDCGDRGRLGGIDLDSCRSAEGIFEPWATEVIDRFGSYAEVSPSGTGAKIFFTYREDDLPRLRGMMGTAQHGKMFKRGGGDHPPAIELHLSNRYFCVTGDRLVECGVLEWILAEAGPAFTHNEKHGAPRNSAMGPRDNSRSAAALRLGFRMRRAGKTFEQMCEALRADPETASWYAEKGIANGERELRRIWEKAEEDDDGLATIRIVAGERPRIVEEAIDALDAAEVPFYRRYLSIVSVAMIPAKASDGTNIVAPALVEVPVQQLAYELGKAAHWVKFIVSRQEWVPIDVPAEVASTIPKLPNEWKFKPIAGIVGTQTMRPNGTILDKPGYDPATGYVLFRPPAMPPIPEVPTKRDAERALYTLNRLLDEFPFAFDAEGRHTPKNNPSRSVGLAMLMTPVLRPALAPTVPLLVVQKPACGSGGSYLCDLAAALATGERCPVLAKAMNPEETEKRLVSAALNGQPIISIDNCNGELRSEFLCQAVERPLLQVRMLGVSKDVTVANSVSYFANGNNIQIAEDLVRRTLQCRLDANMERPETREFRRNPLADILADRGKFVAAVLTIARAYVVAGMPDRPPRFMSFDRWSDVVRGSLMWLGHADPCDTVADLAVADPVKSERAEVFRAIAAAMVDPNYTVAEIIAAARTSIEAGNALRMVATGRDGEINPRRLGKWLAASQNTIAGGHKLMSAGSVQNRVRWRLAPVPR